LDGICKVTALVAKAKEFGMKALAITDHGNVDGAVKFYKECKKAGIKPLVGSELYWVDEFEKSKDMKRYHVLVLAKNFNGLRSIMKALTVAHQQQFYYRPLVTFDQVLGLEDVVVMTACASGVLAHPEFEAKAKSLYRRFGKNFFFETQPWLKFPPQALVYQRAIQLMKKSGIPIIATNDVHYLNKDEYLAHEVALAIGTHKLMSDKDRYKFDVRGLHLRTAAEMYETLIAEGAEKKLAGMMVNSSLMVADRIDFTMDKVEVDLPIPHRFRSNKPNTKILEDLAWAGMQKRGLTKKKEYVDRLKHELNEVITLGFATYFLILADVIWWCRENDLMVGPGRGSVGGSILAYCLFITEVDPLQYGLSFERFISPGRIDLPDIDVDFQDDRREEIVSYFRGQYGDENVLQVRTFNEMHGRQALRDVARVFSVPVEEVGKAAKAIVKRSGGDAREDYSIEDAFTLFEECKAFAKKYPKVVKVAQSLEGITRQGGIHAAGVVISDKPLYDGQRCVVISAKDGVQSINWDKKDLDDFGLMKLDVLGLSTLTVLHRAKELIEKHHGNTKIVFENINLADKKVIFEFNRGNTIGVFQFGTPGLGSYCREIGVKCFDDLVDINALWRPGTLKSGMTAEFKEIKNGRKGVTPVSEYYDNITKATLGIMLYQEQIMQVLYQGAGIGWRTVDTIRKAISKSEGNEKIAGFKKEFTEGCAKLGTMAEDEAAAVFDKMVFFGSYGFNKSHAVAYTKIGFWTMWLKVYYPTEFYCSLINFATQDKRMEYVDDARKNGITVLLPDVNKSGKIWTMEGPGVIRAGLSSITSISERSAEEILKSRLKHSDRIFQDFDSFLKQVPRRTINKRVIQNLGKSGALRSLGIGVLCSQDIDAVLKGNYELDADESNPEILHIVGDVVDFSPSSDPLYKISAIVDRIKKKIPLNTLKQVADREVTGECTFVGKIDKIKFSYRDKVSKGSNDLGGAYGNFYDGSDHMMITFDNRATNSVDNIDVKKKIETAEECWVLIHATVAPDKRSGTDVKLLVRKIVFLEELIGEVNLAFFPAAKIGFTYKGEGQPFDDEVLDCHECTLRDTCTAPVRPNRGRFDVMVVAEAPGREEDEQGIGLLGKAGKNLWDELAKYQIKRNLLHVNNVVKCRPPNNKIPNINMAHKCASLWLDREMEQIKPLIVLAAGGTAADYFIKDAKITELNGKVIWNAKHSCWVVYCLHPASIIYEQSNKEAFSKAIGTFANLMYCIYK
jgi:DNA polymerase-3 subunit alpha